MKRTTHYLLYLLTFTLMLFLPAMITQAASKQQPGYVSNVTASTSSGTNKVTITWKKASNATSYRVYYKQSGGKWRAIADTRGTKYTHTSSKKYPLVAGKKYIYTVRAYNRYGRRWGSYDSRGKAVTIPAVPGTVKVSSVKAKTSGGASAGVPEVSISWGKVSNATSYNIYYKESGNGVSGSWKKLAAVNSRTSSFTHRSSASFPLKPGKKYVYTVRAYNGTFKKWGGYSTKGWSVSIPKKPAATPTPVPAKIPGTVTSCRVYAQSYDETFIIWDKVENATSYAVFYKESGAKDWKKITTIKNNVPNYIHKSFSIYSLEPGKTYIYTVRAYNDESGKWGGYNTKGWSVTMPEKPEPTATPKPTEAPQPSPEPNPEPNPEPTTTPENPEPSTAPEEPTVTPQPTTVPEPTATPKPTATPTPKPTATPKPTEPAGNEKAEEMAREVIRLTNIERKKEGLSELKYHAKLQQAAMVRAKELVKNYSHTRPDGRNCDTAVFEAGAANPIAENAGAGKTTPKGIVSAWMNSGGHKASIMDPHSTHIGVGYYCDSDGTGYWIQVFAKNPDAKCTLTVDGNGGTFPSKGDVESFEMVVPQGMSLEIEDISTPVKSNCIFNGYISYMGDIPLNKKPSFSGTLHLSYDQELKASWSENSSSAQSILTDNITPSITEDLFTDGNTDEEMGNESESPASDATSDNHTEDTIELDEIDEADNIYDSGDIIFAYDDSIDTPTS